MSFSNPVAKSVGADGTAPGRVWESRLLPALIIPDSVGGVLCVPVGRTGTPPTFFVVVLFACLLATRCGGVWGFRCVGGVVWGGCGGIPSKVFA